MQHLAMIMDGNRRWAKKQGFSTVYQRKEVIQSVRTAARFCIKKGIRYLSLYMTSLENAQQRSRAVLNAIFDVTVKTCKNEVDELIKQGIRIRFVGERSVYPEHVKAAIDEIETSTASQTKLTMSLLFFYGAQQEIVSAAKRVAIKVQNGEISPDQIDEQTLEASMWMGAVPRPDLIIRTGAQNRVRLSNFLLFQAAYSELQFIDPYWPELSEDTLEQCLTNYHSAVRNVGS